MAAASPSGIRAIQDLAEEALLQVGSRYYSENLGITMVPSSFPLRLRCYIDCLTRSNFEAIQQGDETAVDVTELIYHAAKLVARTYNYGPGADDEETSIPYTPHYLSMLIFFEAVKTLECRVNFARLELIDQTCPLPNGNERIDRLKAEITKRKRVESEDEEREALAGMPIQPLRGFDE